MFETWYVCSFAGLVNALADLSMLGDETEREVGTWCRQNVRFHGIHLSHSSRNDGNSGEGYGRPGATVGVVNLRQRCAHGTQLRTTVGNVEMAVGVR